MKSAGFPSLTSVTGMGISVGVDIGGTKILVGVVNDHGEILTKIHRKTPRADALAVLSVVSDAIAETISHVDGSIAGIGVGVAGPVDAGSTTVLYAPNLQWADVPVAAVLENAIDLPVLVENDGNAAAWGEARFGGGEGFHDVVTVTIGTGIGGGIVLGGELFRGSHGAAGEIGHMGAVADGLLCGCGRKGCWEQYASGNALVRDARAMATERLFEAQVLLSLGDGSPEGVQGEHVTEAATLGDPVAIEVLERLGVWLGRGLASLSAILDPQIFVIGGGASEASEFFLPSARATLADRIIGKHYRPIPEIHAAQLGNEAGIVGAADLARLKFSPLNQTTAPSP
jgi:glucokinase